VRHPVREGPGGARAVLVAAERGGERGGGAAVRGGHLRRQRQRQLGHQAVAVWSRQREAAVGPADRGQRVRRPGGRRGLEGDRGVLQRLDDERRLDRALARQVPVEGGGLEAGAPGQPPHRERVAPLLVEQVAGRRDDGGAARRQAAAGHRWNPSRVRSP
jgi:hypothetical protein